MVRGAEAVIPRHWIRPEVYAEVLAIWRAGNDFSTKDIARALNLTEAQVCYAVRDQPKTPLQQRRHDLSSANARAA